MAELVDPHNLQDELLYELFKFSKNRSNGYVRLRHLKFPAGPLAGMEANFLNRLKSRALVESRNFEADFKERNPGLLGSLSMLSFLQPQQEFQISLDGIEHVLEELQDVESHIAKLASGNAISRVRVGPGGLTSAAKTIAPAIERGDSVDLRERSQDVEQIKEAIDELDDRLREGNDLGSITPAERDQVREELRAFRQLLDSVSIQVAYVRMVASETVRWVADKAGGALVGEAAKHLLKLLLHLSGSA